MARSQWWKPLSSSGLSCSARCHSGVPTAAPLSTCCCLFTHSDWNIIMSVIFSYKSHHGPVLLWVIGIKCDEFISAVFIQSINSDGMLQSICKKKHFHLGINSSPYLLKASSLTGVAGCIPGKQ
uniref:Uncharacterized protein n=1 Tax=Chelonoidis abingdonii TaxID=106734 RepID=A0A8C0GAA4_CHEAB